MHVCFFVLGTLKCKKDKAYEGGQLCAMCASPQKLHKQEIHKLKDITCLKPSIESPLRQNRSRDREEEEEQEEDGDSPLSLEGFQFPPWNISLNMTDEHGNTVNLVCDIKKPTGLYKIHLNQTDPQEIDINATVALDFECPMTRENYEKLWKLIAYYSEVPVKLNQELTLSRDPRVSYQYRQDANDDALYYTGVRAHILAEPEWVMQPTIDIQLNRRQSTAKKVLLSYYSHYSLTIPAKEARQSRSRSWVMIEPSRTVQTAQTVLEGGPCQLSCNVKASESPSIYWVLPDGSVLKAPMEDQDRKFSILTSGWLKIRSAEQSDSGFYQCIAQVRDEMDRMVYRVFVQPPATQPPDGHTVTIQKNPGESVLLPCSALAIPEAQLSWILPNKRIITNVANTSHAYMLANGTLSIPKVQVSDGGYYRCVAVNQQGADHFTVGVTVSKKGSGRSSKKGRHPGGKNLSRVPADVVEDEGGSGLGEEENASRRVLHTQDQETLVKTKDKAITGGKKTKKGRRKLKPWKSSEKEPETNIAEGRRVFESRRRINMANKQINPERWADILARVRGKNLPEGKATPQGIKSTTPPSARPEVTLLFPAVPPPSVSPPEPTTSTEETSADASLFGEEDQVSSTVASTKMEPESGHDGVIPAEPKVSSMLLGEMIDHDFSKTEEMTPTQVDPQWATAMALTSVPYESSTLQALDTVYEEPTNENTGTESWPAGDVGSVPEPDGYESPLAADALAESETNYPDLETNSQPGGENTKELTFTQLTPTTVLWVVDSRTSEPLDGLTLGEPAVQPQGHPWRQTDSAQLGKGALSTQGNPLIEKGTEENSQTLQEEENSQTPQEGDMPERDPTTSRDPESMGKRVKSTTPPDSAPGMTKGMAPSKHPSESTLSGLFDKDSTTVAAVTPTQKATSAWGLTTHTSRKRPNGRKRLRPHRFRNRHKQTQPTTSAPTGTFSTAPTQVPEVKVPEPVESSLVPTSWTGSSVDVPKQVEMEKQAEPVSRGTPRRKHGKRPNKHRYSTSTTSFPTSALTPSPPPENKHKNHIVPSPQTPLLSTTISLTTGDPREMATVGDSMTTTPKRHSSPNKLHETIPVTYKPISDGTEMKSNGVTNINEHKTDSSGPDGTIRYAASPSTVGQFQEGSAPSSFPGASRWNPPGAAASGTLPTDTPATSPAESLTDSPFLQWLEDLGFPSEFPPSVAASTLLQPKEVLVSTPVSSIKVEPSPSRAETTISAHDRQEPTPGKRPWTRAVTPSSIEEAASPFLATTLVSVIQTFTEPTYLASRTPPTSTDSQENVFLNYVGIPETRAAPVNKEGTQHVLRPHELSTPSSNQNKFNLTPKQELEKESFDGKTPNGLPHGPDGNAGRVHVFHQPARVTAKPIPLRGTVRPPHMTTEGSFRYFITPQPPRHLTNKPEITAYPSRVWPENKHLMTPRLPSGTNPIVLTPKPKPHIPSKFPDQGMDRFGVSPKVFGDNKIPDLREPVGKLPSSRVPHYPNGRFPFFFNRTVSFPQLGATQKPQMLASPAPGIREKKVNPGPNNRIHSQSIIHMDFGPPAPPLSHPPWATGPPSTNVQNIPMVYSTRSSIPIMVSSGQPSRSFHQSTSKLFSAGGPPASKFWTHGEKPQIITKPPQTVSVSAETDVVFPCEATGKPTPFITWTKVSTGKAFTCPHFTGLCRKGLLERVALVRTTDGWDRRGRLRT